MTRDTPTVRVAYFGGPRDGALQDIPRAQIIDKRQLLTAGLQRITAEESRRRAALAHPAAIPTVVDVYVVGPVQSPAGPVQLTYAGQDTR